MRTTIRLDPDLLQEIKVLAARRRRTMAAIIEEAVRAHLAQERARPRLPVSLPTEAGLNLMPGVNLDSNSDLLDTMEERDVPRRR